MPPLLEQPHHHPDGPAHAEHPGQASHAQHQGQAAHAQHPVRASHAIHAERPDRTKPAAHAVAPGNADQTRHPAHSKRQAPPPAATVLELLVDNHAGTMSHICGLFSRRSFSLEGILCLPVGDGGNSRMWLRVLEHERLDQVLAQLAKLEEVISIRRTQAGDSTFGDLAKRYLPPEERLAGSATAAAEG